MRTEQVCAAFYQVSLLCNNCTVIEENPPTYSVSVSYIANGVQHRLLEEDIKQLNLAALKGFLNYCSVLFSQRKPLHQNPKNILTFHSISLQCGLQDTILIYIARIFSANKRHFEDLPVCQKLNLQLDPAMSVPLQQPSLSMGINQQAA